MSFELSPIKQPMIQSSQRMQNNGGGGNLGYMQQDKKKKDEQDETTDVFDSTDSDTVVLEFTDKTTDFDDDGSDFSLSEKLGNIVSNIASKIKKKEQNPFKT